MSNPYMPTTESRDRDRAQHTEAPAALRATPEPNGVITMHSPVVSGAVPSSDKPTTTDALINETTPTEWPPGAPKFRALFRLPFRARATATRLLAKVEDSLPEFPEKGTEVDMSAAAGMWDVFGDIDDFLAYVAEDEETYRKYSMDLMTSGKDELFMQLFRAYQDHLQPGEADSSTS